MNHHIRLPDGFGRWVLANRVAILVVVLLTTIAGAWSASRAPLRTSILEGFMADQSRFLEYRRRAEQFGGATDDVLYIGTREGESLLTPAKLDAIRAAARELEGLPMVQRVESLPDAPWLSERPLSTGEVAGRRLARRRVLNGGELPDVSEYAPPRYWPEDPAEQAEVDLAQLRRAALADPLLRGILLSADGRCQGMILQLRPEAHIEGAEQISLRRDLERIVQSHGLGADGVHTAGVLISQGWMVSEAIRSMALLLPIGALVVCLLIQAMFGRLSLVVLTLLIAAIAVAWGMGAVALLYGEISLFVAGVPLLVLVISTSDTVHLASAYMQEVESGTARDHALLKVIQDVGGACILTSVTTFVGFLSLMVVPAATVRHLALAASVGVAGALLLALTLVPIVLFYAPIRPRAERKKPGAINRLVDLVVERCKRLVLGRPRLLFWGHLALMAAALVATFRLRSEADFPKRFPTGHPYRESIEFFSQELIGANAIELYVTGPPGELLTPESLQALDELDRRLAALPEVQWTASLPSVLRLGGNLLGIEPDNPAWLPANAEVATRLLALLDQSGGRPETIVLPDQGATRLVVRVAPTGVFEILRLADAIERIARETLPKGFACESSGMYPIIGRASLVIIENQLKGFVLCFVVVLVIVSAGVRSARLGLLSIAPNLMPLVIFSGTLGLWGGVVDTDALAVAVIAFGIVVDDTIHFLHRYRIERVTRGTRREAISRTFDYTGMAMVRTTVILCLGLLPFALSGYASLRMLGTYLAAVLAWALVGDMLLLPTSLLLFDKKDGERGAGSGKRREGSKAEIE